MGIETQFRQGVEQLTGLEDYNLAIKEGLERHKGAILLQDGKTISVSKVRDIPPYVDEVRKIQSIVAEVFGTLQESSASWHRCSYVGRVVKELEDRVGDLNKRLFKTKDYESVSTQLVSLSTDTKAVINWIDHRMGVLSQHASISTMFSSLPILPDWKYEDFLDLYYFVEQLGDVAVFNEYSKRNQYGKTDVVFVNNEIWVLAVSQENVRIFMNWKDQRLMTSSGDIHADPLKIFRKHPEKTNFSSVDHVIEVGLAYVRGYRVFHEKKGPINRQPRIVVAVPSSIGEYVQMTPSANFIQDFKQWISSALNVDNVESLPEGSFFRGLSHIVALGELETYLLRWEELEDIRKKEEGITFYQRIGTGVLAHIPRIQALMSKRLRSSLSAPESTTLGLYDWILSFVGYGSSNVLSADEVAKQENLREAHRLFILFLRDLVEIKDENNQAQAVTQLISICESVNQLLNAGEKHQDYEDVVKHHNKLHSGMTRLHDWQLEGNLPSFVRVAYEFYQQKESRTRCITALFPIQSDGTRHFLRVAMWIKPNSRIMAVYDWGVRKFYCIKLREHDRAKREKEWLPQLKCGIKKVEIVSSELVRLSRASKDHLVEDFMIVGEPDDQSDALLTKFVFGTNLNHYVAQSSLSNQEKLEIFLKIAQCLLEVHRKDAIFQDLKLEQFVRKNDGSIVLVDGESIASTNSEFREGAFTSLILVAPEIMDFCAGATPSPEDILSVIQLTKENDIWMLGWIAYFIFINTRKELCFEPHYQLFIKNPTRDALATYISYFTGCVTEKRHWQPLSERTYLIWENSFAKFVNQLIGKMLALDSTSRPTAEQIVEETQGYLERVRLLEGGEG